MSAQAQDFQNVTLSQSQMMLTEEAHPALKTSPPPRPKDDNLIIRKGLDSFIRPWDTIMREVKYKTEWSGTGPKILNGMDYDMGAENDHIIEACLAEKPDLAEALRSVARVKVESKNADGQVKAFQGTGFFVSKLHLFTALHILDCEEGYYISNIHLYLGPDDGKCIPIPARRLDLDADFLKMIDPNLKISKGSLAWGVNPLDFAVLEIKEEISIITPLIIPEEPQYGAEDVIAAIGYPQFNPNTEYSECFEKQFAGIIKRTLSALKQDPQKILRHFFFSSVDQFRNPLVAFGMPSVKSESNKYYFMQGSFSTTFGSSGGPVVLVGNPKLLAGMIVGSFEGMGSSTFLDCQTPIVKAVYRQLNAKED